MQTVLFTVKQCESEAGCVNIVQGHVRHLERHLAAFHPVRRAHIAASLAQLPQRLQVSNHDTLSHVLANSNHRLHVTHTLNLRDCPEHLHELRKLGLISMTVCGKILIAQHDATMKRAAVALRHSTRKALAGSTARP